MPEGRPAIHAATDRRTAAGSGRSERHVAGIDGLRAIAVLSVMIYHLKGAALHGGFVGVDVFFVISGFVVTLSIYRRRFESFPRLLAYFYARRLIRIAPALVAMLLVASLLTVLFVPYAWLSDTNRTTAFYAFFGLSNVRLAQTADDYFGPRTDFNPFAHTWSLGVEEQFYLIFPLLIAATVLARSRRGPRFSLAMTLALSAVSFAACVLLSRPAPIFSFFEIPTRFWELGLGTVLALSAWRWNASLQRVNAVVLDVVGLAALAALIVSFVLCDKRYFPFPLALPPVAASAVAICILYSRRPTLFGALLSSKLATAIGLLSYSLYLWHWPIYVLLRWTTGMETFAYQALAVVATFAASAASYVLVEQPFRTSAYLARIPRSAAVAALLFVAFFGAMISRIMFHYNSALTLSVTGNAPVWSPYDLAVGGCAVAVSSHAVGPSQVTTLSAPCPRGPSNGRERRLFVAGDSHASSYARLFATLASLEGYRVVIHTRLGCAFLDLRTPSEELGVACSEFERLTEASILRDTRPGDFVFLPSLRVARYRNEWGGDIRETASVAGEAASAVSAAGQFLRALSRHGVHVVLEAPTPMFKSPPFRCSDWFNRSNPVCAAGFSVSRKETEARRSRIMDISQGFAASIAGVTVWDPAAVLCGSQRCSAFDGAGPLFFDGDHLSGHGDDRLYRSFAEHLRESVATDSQSKPRLPTLR